jgi:uncharacterized protein YjbI with pentapeptide repeats
MANQEHLELLKQGEKVWNEWRESNPAIEPDLKEANLMGEDLGGMKLDKVDLSYSRLGALYLNDWYETRLLKADLREANLENADLHFADFTGADLRKAKLSNAFLYNANLIEVDLREADLSNANLSNSYLKKSDLRKAKLSNVNLSESYLQEADLREANLSNVYLREANLAGANLQGANLYGAFLYKANLTYANLENANLSLASLVETDLSHAKLTNCLVYGIAAWEVNLNESKQAGLIITHSHQNQITVENLEVAQFLYMLLNNKKIRDVIDTVARKVVLILGRFTPMRKKILDALHKELSNRDYIPVLFDFDKPRTRDITETMRTLAHLSRFIIADITDPRSIPLELLAVVPDLAVPVQPLLLSGKDEFSMFIDLRKKYHWVLSTLQYEDLNDLLLLLADKVIMPAEQKAKELNER